ncbi:MAG: sigma-70 family RNA polymerase sigma factor [Phycisphaerae bacterium]|nr:sigma-70 family RNA polymerase sigma factor [Phycisphaerae bacterium]
MPFESTKPSLLVRVRDPSDLNAWREFEARYRELIVRYCLRRGLQMADCEDVQQLVWINLCKGIRTFEYDPRRGRFRDYLRRTVRNAIARHFARPNQAPRALDTAVLAVFQAEVEQDTVWDQEWVNHHYRLAMQTVRATFEPRSVALFEGLLGGQSAAELADSFGVSAQSVHKVKQRIQKRLGELIAGQIQEEDHTDAGESRSESSG